MLWPEGWLINTLRPRWVCLCRDDQCEPLPVANIFETPFASAAFESQVEAATPSVCWRFHMAHAHGVLFRRVHQLSILVTLATVKRKLTCKELFLRSADMTQRDAWDTTGQQQCHNNVTISCFVTQRRFEVYGMFPRSAHFKSASCAVGALRSWCQYEHLSCLQRWDEENLFFSRTRFWKWTCGTL